MTCSTCRHGQPAQRYPAEYRHCPVAAQHYRIPVTAWAGVSCPPEVNRWTPIDSVIPRD